MSIILIQQYILLYSELIILLLPLRCALHRCVIRAAAPSRVPHHTDIDGAITVIKHVSHHEHFCLVAVHSIFTFVVIRHNMVRVT